MSKIRESAKGEECQLRLFPYCLGEDTSTVVLCHMPSEDKGMGRKSPDHWSSYGCVECHKIVDSVTKTDIPREEILECMMAGIYRTQRILIEKGLITVPKDGTKNYNK